MVAVNANGLKSSPTMPDTNAIGKNTATEVIVEAVIAPPTSRTASTIVVAALASGPASPR